MINTKRESRDIVVDILKLCVIPRKKTAVVYQCNLNFNTVNPYLSWCYVHGWLVKSDDEYQTTELGKTYLEMIKPVLLLEEKILIDGEMI